VDILFHGVSNTYLNTYMVSSGTRWRGWLRNCATCQEVAGSIPDEATGILHWHKPSGRFADLVRIQPLNEVRYRNISWWQRQPVCRTDNISISIFCPEIWKPQTLLTLRIRPDLHRDWFTFLQSVISQATVIAKHCACVPFRTLYKTY